MKVKTMKSVRFDKATMEKVSKLAKEENRSFNNMVDTIILRYIKSNNL